MIGYKLRWTKQAQRDLQCVYDFVSKEDVKAAQHIIARFHEASLRLEDYPEMGRAGRVEETRELIILNTPYIIVYRILPPEVHVLAVLHQSRKWPDLF